MISEIQDYSSQCHRKLVNNKMYSSKAISLFLTHLCDFLSDIVSSVFDFWCNDGRLRCRWGMRLLISCLCEVERDKRDLVEGAVLVDVGVGGRAEQAGLDVVKRA